MGGKIKAVDGAPPAPTSGARDVILEATGSGNSKWGANLLNRTIGTLAAVGRSGTDEEARAALVSLTLDSLAAFAPKDPVEGLLAAQAVAMHHAAMECFRRAMLSEQPPETAAKLRKDGTNMSRAVVDMVEALARHRGKGPQVVRVERVVVHDGGQAIVGAVSTGEGRG